MPRYDRQLARARAQLDEETFKAAWAAGQALTAEQAVAEALALPEAAPALPNQVLSGNHNGDWLGPIGV